MNLYAYEGNDPTNFIDPTGMCRSNNGNPNNDCKSEVKEEEVVVTYDGDGQSSGSGYTWTDFFIDAALVGVDLFTGPTPDVAAVGIPARHAPKQMQKN